MSHRNETWGFDPSHLFQGLAQNSNPMSNQKIAPSITLNYAGYGSSFQDAPRTMRLNDELYRLLQSCSNEMRTVNAISSESERIGLWAQLTCLHACGLVRLGIVATEDGKKVLATLDALHDELGLDYGYKSLRLKDLERQLDESKARVEALTGEVQEREGEIVEMEAAQRTRVDRLERDLAIVRREVGEARWREILGGAQEGDEG